MRRRESCLLRKPARCCDRLLWKWVSGQWNSVRPHCSGPRGMCCDETSRGFHPFRMMSQIYGAVRLPLGIKYTDHRRSWFKTEGLHQKRASLSSSHVGLEVSFKVGHQSPEGKTLFLTLILSCLFLPFFSFFLFLSFALLLPFFFLTNLVIWWFSNQESNTYSLWKVKPYWDKETVYPGLTPGEGFLLSFVLAFYTSRSSLLSERSWINPGVRITQVWLFGFVFLLP